MEKNEREMTKNHLFNIPLLPSDSSVIGWNKNGGLAAPLGLILSQYVALKMPMRTFHRSEERNDNLHSSNEKQQTRGGESGGGGERTKVTGVSMEFLPLEASRR